LAALLTLAAAAPARAWLYDQNQNRIDDRIEAVHTQGLAAAYENGDVTKRMLIGVAAGPPITYRVYVGYDHHPTLVDVQAVTTLGGSVLYAFHSIDYLEVQASYSQISAVILQPTVTRLTAVQVMYASNHY